MIKITFYNLNLSKFYRNSSHRDGYKNICKKCDSQRRTKIRQQKKKQLNRKSKENYIKIRENMKPYYDYWCSFYRTQPHGPNAVEQTPTKPVSSWESHFIFLI